MKQIDIEELRRKVGTFDEPVEAEAAPGAEAPGQGEGRRAAGGAGEAATLHSTTGMFEGDAERQRVLADAHAALAWRDLTAHELREKLRAKEHAEELVEHAVQACTRAGVVNDDRYASAFVAGRVRRGHGAMRIRQDLRRRGIEGPVVEELLSEAREGGELDAAALEAARRRFARVDLTQPKERGRAMRFLMRRGYGGDQAGTALRRLQEEQAAD